MRELLYKVAEVLEEQALAEDVRAAAPAVKKADEAPKDVSLAEKVASAYKERTGEVLPEEIQAKLTDPAVADFAAKMAGVGGTMNSLGEAEDVGGPSDAPTHLVKTERAKAAYDRFGDFLAGQHR